MRVTSERQRQAWAQRELPAAEEVTEGVHAIPLGMPNSAIPYSLCYLVDGGDGTRHLIDTGVDSDENWVRLRTVIESTGAGLADLASVTVSHMHHDHAGMAMRLRRATGATVRMHEIDARSVRDGATFLEPEAVTGTLRRWGVPPDRAPEIEQAARRRIARDIRVDVDEELRGGEILRAGVCRLHVVHTPGHTSGHVMIVDDERGLVFTGDHVLPGIHPGIGLGAVSESNPLDEYFASLTRTADWDGHEVCPGHGYRFAGLAERCASIREHHERRTREVRSLGVDAVRLPIWQIAQRLSWTDGFDRLAGTALFSALRQTEMHVRRVRSSLTSSPDG